MAQLRTDLKNWVAPATGVEYQLDQTPAGNTQITDVTQYTQEGDSWTAELMNETNAAVNALSGEVNTLDTDLTALQGQVDDLSTYSYEETRIGDWLGKPLYRKVVNFGALPDTTSKSISAGTLNADDFATVKGVASSGGAVIPIPYTAPSALNQAISVVMDSMGSGVFNIRVSTGVVRSNFSRSFFVLEYTKTTD